VLRSYDLHANCYITKPVDFEQFIGVVQAIEKLLADGRDPPQVPELHLDRRAR